jgi:serine protease Do
MKKIKLKAIFIVFVLILLLAVTLGPGCITITTPETPDLPSTTQTSTPTPINPEWTPPSTANQTNQLPGIADVVAMVKPSVVAITTEVVGQSIFGQYTQEGAGSGWIIDEKGIIVTNNHVVEGARSITVTTDSGDAYNADIESVATDYLNDLAILKIDAQDLPALKIGDTSRLRVGDWVIAIGNALGQGIRATEGIVSRKEVSLSVDQGQTLYDLIETSAAINPGNSGGPLVNLAGEVIGITSAKVTQIGVEGMGYAISIDTATPIIQQLVNNGYVVRPFLGVQNLLAVDQSVARYFGLSIDNGVLIRGVLSNSPATRAGLAAGDVIIKLGGDEVASVQDLTKVLYTSEIGKPLEVVYVRKGKEHTVSVVPVESPPPS